MAIQVHDAVEECLAYIRTRVLSFDVEELRKPLQLPGEHPSEWQSALETAPSATVLRSEALRPFARFLIDWEMPDEHALETGMVAFRQARQRLLAGPCDPQNHCELVTQQEISRPHSFIIMEPDNSLSDGAARVASGGYFDDNNIPPWDTWVTVLPARAGHPNVPGLLCWVPAWAHEQVAAGICVNPEQCVYWFELPSGQITSH